MSPDLKARVLEAARKERSETRPERSRRTAIVVAASLVFATAVFLVLGGAHVGTRPLVFVVATIGGWAAIAVGVAPLAFARGRSMLGRGTKWLVATAVATPAVLFGWMLLWNAIFPETAQGIPDRIGLRCLLFTVLVAALPVAGLAIVRRERDPVHAGAAGAARGVAAGALVGVLVDAWCPIAHPAHVAVGHVFPLVLLAAFGGLLGRRLSGVTNGRR